MAKQQSFFKNRFFKTIYRWISKIFKWTVPTPAFYWIIRKTWEFQGRPVPPPKQVKHLIIKDYHRRYKARVFIETGTYLGETVFAVRNDFRKIISIELGRDLYNKAVERFKLYPHIQLYQGDSGKILSAVLPDIKEKAIFWLDAHYSAGITVKGDKESPILEELDAILGSDLGHIILIDDARCFNGQNDYPTFDELEKYVNTKDRRYKIEVKDDVIRITRD